MHDRARTRARNHEDAAQERATNSSSCARGRAVTHPDARLGKARWGARDATKLALKGAVVLVLVGLAGGCVRRANTVPLYQAPLFSGTSAASR
jgi:hypothetical protein